MPIKPKSSNHSFTEKYYQNKFNEKKLALATLLEKNPNNLAVKEQIQYIDDLLEEGNIDMLSTAWQKWEKDNFYPKLAKNTPTSISGEMNWLKYN